jgi:hypothetical protein
MLFDIIKKYALPEELSWVKAKTDATNQILQTAFVATPRFISKTPISEHEQPIHGVVFNNWTLDRLVRVYLLTKFDSSVKENYIKTLDTLFETAENNEAVALVSALPFLAYPEHWLLRATDAVRSNIGLVFDAIAFENPYPKSYFSELAWNQLVLKCIFNDKPIHRIQGLNERANPELANSISNLAHERWAAGRTIPSQAWRLVSPFMNDQFFSDICLLFASHNENDQIAAALVCNETDFIPAKEELEKQVKTNPSINNNRFNWQILEV